MITLHERAERVAARKRELGWTDEDEARLRAARNDGRTRTPEKRAMLEMIERLRAERAAALDHENAPGAATVGACAAPGWPDHEQE
jgi:hypothetical protein